MSMTMKLIVVALASLLFAVSCSYGQSTPAFTVANIQSYTVVARSGNSTLYTVNLDGADYSSGLVQVIDLRGSRYQMGFDYGYLLGEEIIYNFNKLFHALLGDKWYTEAEITVLMDLIEWQWNGWLSKEVPEQFLEEIRGIQEGGRAAKVDDRLDRYVTAGITLANMPGDVGDVKFLLEREWNNRNKDNRFDLKKYNEKRSQPKKISGLQCSMFSVWGSRTDDTSLFSGRNLDWNQDTGINKNKLLTIFNPDDGAYAHATVGFAGLYGALTGMSSKGISVMEANLEETEITFSGFPWTLRLRYVMENAANLEEGIALWKATNNTVGFNHMIASASDAGVGTHPAVALETMFNYTAYFLDDDPREQSATYTEGNGTQVQIGFPLPEALWRTNHGYDPIIRSHFEWSQAPNSWSMERYMFAHEAFTSYERNNVAIDFLEAINITSILGDKGSDPYVCPTTPDGSNIVSATYHGGNQTLWAAWEDGSGSTWKPAACSIYVHFDMSYFWN